ncbi:MAG: Activator of 2-hydroxyglutaryl-CoA dehydratase, HSP70-class ATPase [Candidatus Methanohalarchaeum thermophilum]|uniref:Activator of 2-hydroxyglutaryl-CoA dehydratase, HSP70-class ATPase n=1 Tax=Methanohalarchaeum thermophilum TaxID=1903181 RepID=A0A1Q6DVK7_METT1|nr:MAG: Activator of 2-hydroxyglutaryl-CoA dehydratase, HSP70-class ATPase [Candidatus Methanohalarchaeum thermophilum]
MIKIAQLSCGSEYSGIQKEIEEAADSVGAEVFYPDVEFDEIEEAIDEFGFVPASPNLRLMIARAKKIVDGEVDADAAVVLSCFRCSEGALVRSEVRKFLQQNTEIPVVTYAFTEKTDKSELLTRMEALVSIVEKKDLLSWDKQTGISAGIDSGSSTTKCVIMKENEIIGKDWTPTKEVVPTAQKVFEEALKDAGLEKDDIEKIGVSGYGRHTIGDAIDADLIIEELTAGSKGAAWLANRLKGGATIIDIGGMDNKAINIYDGIPDGFTMGGICAGASGRFLEMTADRIGVEIEELGEYASRGDPDKVEMDSYCAIFGVQDLVTSLSEGSAIEDVAAAACYSVAEQVYQNQLQEVEIRTPIIEVGGTALIEGLHEAMRAILGLEEDELIVPENPQYAVVTGAALLASAVWG